MEEHEEVRDRDPNPKLPLLLTAELLTLYNIKYFTIG
jgi:hypothetical protein